MLPKIFKGKRRRLFQYLFAVVIAESVTLVGLNYYLRATISSITAVPATGLDWWAAFVLTVLAILAATLFVIGAIIAETLGLHYAKALRVALFDRVINKQYQGNFGGRYGTELVRMTSDLNSVRDWIGKGLCQSVLSIGVFIAGMVSLVIYDLQMGLLLVGVSSSIWMLAVFFTFPHLRRHTIEARKNRGRLSGKLGGVVLAAQFISIADSRRRERRRLKQQSDTLNAGLIKRCWSVSVIAGVATLVVPMSIVLIGILQTGDWVRFDFSLADWSGIVFALGLIAAALSRLSISWDFLVAFMVAKKRLGDILLRYPPPTSPHNTFKAKGTPFFPMQIAVRHFSYDSDRKAVIINAGDVVLLKGPSGSGKSRLFRALAQGQQGDSATVTFGGDQSFSSTDSDLREAIQIVSPAFPLMHGSLKRALTYGNQSIDAVTLQLILEMCELNSGDIAHRPPLSDRIYESGENLSSGMAAKLRLARGLVAMPRLLLIDDAELLQESSVLARLPEIAARFQLGIIVAARNLSDMSMFTQTVDLSACHEDRTMKRAELSVV